MTTNINEKNEKIEKKEFTFVDRLTFIDAVVNKTIADGYEYKNLYTALFLASMLYDYEPTVDEDDNVNINEVWNDLRHFIINGEECDLYEMLTFEEGVFLFDSIHEDVFPIPTYIIIEMLKTIDKKLNQYYSHSRIEDSLITLIDSVTKIVNDYDSKYKDLDIEEVAEKLTIYADAINGKDMKEVAGELASIIHKENQKRDMGGHKKDQQKKE